MSNDERVSVECPNCKAKVWFNKRELCGREGVIVREKNGEPKHTRRRITLKGKTCYNCGYDFSKKAITIDCEGFE